MIAVDPDVIPLGSTVEIRLADGSTFEATAQDVGGAINGAEIDVLMADVNDAMEFGRQAVEVRVTSPR
ncbi:3D domain-containing protein [Paenibacillus sp. FSL L8-0436]|uniref:3D domain-containing protein n=1 Tax=Paenibacillus sp. FSL L8-0436 TaxID=2954686 RepID=UPI003158AAF7